MQKAFGWTKLSVTGAILVAVALAIMIYYIVQQQRSLQTAPGPNYWPTQGWQSCAPEEQGIDSAKMAEALQGIRAGDINIHSLLVIRNGMIVTDAHFYPYDGTVTHDLASVTKSFTTTLVAIAAEQGKVQLDQSLLSFFPQRTIANRDERKERVTVRHLASMSSGLECMGLQQDEGTLTAMYASSDWIKFALDRPMINEPGSQFIYDSPGMHLLSAVLQQATGLSESEFARQNLFAPLGIQDFIWPTDPQGYSCGWGDLHLLPRDAAKLGYLWLNHGVWDGQQIVSRDWVENSVKVQMKTGGEDDYGYGWWVMSGEFGEEYAAVGRGGQRVQIFPSLNMIIVTTGGGFDINEVWPFLSPTLVDPEKPLPPNPEGEAKLQAALAEIVKAPAPQPIAALPAIAKQISGLTYWLDDNPAQLKSVRLDFDSSNQAVLQLGFADSRPNPAQPIGLDGVYRLVAGEYNLPQGGRGYWADADTFVFEQDLIANNEHTVFEMTFLGDRIVINGKQADHELGITFAGRQQ